MLFQAVSEGNSSLKKYGRLCVEFQSVGTLDENGASVNFRDLLAGHCAKATNGIYELEGVDLQMVEDVSSSPSNYYVRKRFNPT